MSENKDIKMALPKLRFPEFCGKQEWKETPIKGLCKIGNGKDYKHLRDGDIPVYGSGGYMLSVNDYLYDGESVCIGRKGTINKPMFLSGKFWTVDTLFYTYSFNKCLPKFLYFIFQNINWLSLNEAGGVPSLSKINIEAKKVFAPEVDEQAKIAECLSSLDDAISGVSDKIEALKEYKKGLMQQLFPAEGKTTPAFRFPEFNDSDEWIETTLGAMLNYENGKAHENGIVIDGHYVVVNSKFISTDGAVRKYTDEPYCIANERDILMVLSDVPNGRAIAKCFLVDKQDYYTVNQRVCRLSTKGTNSDLLYYVINRNKYLLSFDDGVKQTNLKKEDVLKCPLVIPRNPNEQKMIANCLSSIDNLIIAEVGSLTQLKEHKKGLMQQIFPNLNE